jgi:hypothetical protein
VRRPGIVYAMPGHCHTRDAYLAALQESGCSVLRVIDAVVRDVPEGYTRESFIRACGDIPFCLLILARKDGRTVCAPSRRSGNIE